MKRIALASDHAGFILKEKLKSYLKKKGLSPIDLGTYSKVRCDYPMLAYELARAVARKKYPCGILICKSGIGNSIVANRVFGIRAALCYNIKAARLSREHNDSNVLVLASGFVNEKLGKRILGVWLTTEFQGGRHSRRLNQIKKIEQEIKRSRYR